MKHDLPEICDFFKSQCLEVGFKSILDVGGSDRSLQLFGDSFEVNYVSYSTRPKTNLLFYVPDKLYDAVWCSHTLEHVTNVGLFLRRLISCVRPDGFIAVIVPSLRNSHIVDGHLNMFSAESLAYNIVLSGQDLSAASIFKHGANAVVIWRRKDAPLPVLRYDRGDLRVLRKLFPPGMEQKEHFRFYTFVQRYNSVVGSLTGFHKRYYDVLDAWRRTSFQLAKLQGLKGRGLDFGPGTCRTLISADLYGLHIEGLDIKGNFYSLQQSLQERGYTIKWHDTHIYPWPYENETFDFILCADSLFTDWSNGRKDDWKLSPEKAKSRIAELVRILKINGRLCVSGGSNHGTDIDVLNGMNFQYEKPIQIVNLD